VVEAFHASDPLPGTIDFNVPIDRHVAQKNLSVVIAFKSMFHMNFEMHNGSRKEAKFNVRVEQISIKELQNISPDLKEKLKGKKEGKLKKVEFTKERCMDRTKEFSKRLNKSEEFTIDGFGKIPMAVAGNIEGDYVFMVVTQYQDNLEMGGLGIIVFNDKK